MLLFMARSDHLKNCSKFKLVQSWYKLATPITTYITYYLYQCTKYCILIYFKSGVLVIYNRE